MGILAEPPVIRRLSIHTIRFTDISNPDRIRRLFTSCGGTAFARGHELLMTGSGSAYQSLLAQLDTVEDQEIHAHLSHLLAPHTGGRIWKCRGKSWPLGERTCVMGIINVTPDSFSDGGVYFDSAHALDHALGMVEEGADILDIGGESSRPNAMPVSAQEEIRRVIPLIQAITEQTQVLISVDTYKPQVAREALQAGAHIVNDICALADPEMPPVIAEFEAGVVLMHMQGTPQTMQQNPDYHDVVAEIHQFLQGRVEFAEEQGIIAEQIAIDPGIGFGKTIEHNLELLKRLGEFQGLRRPILIGTSRKSFIGHILNRPVEECLQGTAATVACAILQGADIIRVHDVPEMKQVAMMADALR